VASRQSFTLWQQVTIEIKRRNHSSRTLVILFNRSPASIAEIEHRNHSIIACSCHIYMGMAVGRGSRGALAPLDFEIISKKRLFLQFIGVKNKFQHFWPPWKKIWENPLLPPLEKSLPTPMYMSVILRAHLVRGESHIQRNANREVATTSPPFYNEPHRSHVLFVKSASGTTFHILVTALFCCDWKPERQVCKASHWHRAK